MITQHIGLLPSDRPSALGLIPPAPGRQRGDPQPRLSRSWKTAFNAEAGTTSLLSPGVASVAMASSILGKMGEAKELFQRGHKLLADRSEAQGLLEDAGSITPGHIGHNASEKAGRPGPSESSWLLLHQPRHSSGLFRATGSPSNVTVNNMAPNPNTAFMAANLMLVLCFLDIWEIDESIIIIGMASVKMDGFPQSLTKYLECLKILPASEEAATPSLAEGRIPG